MAFGEAIDKLFILIGAKSTMGNDLKGVDGEIDSFKRGAQAHGDQLDSHMGRSFRNIALAGAVAFAAVGAGVGFLGKSMLSGAGNVESYRAILETVTGSAQIAGEKLDWLREFAKKTPFELPGLMEAATRLEAYGLTAQEHLRVLGDTAAAMGKPIMSAVEAVADAQTGEFERLKEFGIKALDVNKDICEKYGLQADAMGKTILMYTDKNGQEQIKLVDRNNRDMVTSNIEAIWNEKYSGAMEKMSTTWQGMVSNMKDAWTQGISDAGTSMLPILKPFVAQLTDFMGGDSFKGTLVALGEVFVTIAQQGMGLFEKLAPSIGTVVGLFGTIVNELGPPLVSVFGKLVDSLISSGFADSLANIAVDLGGAFLSAVNAVLPVLDLFLDIFVSLPKPVQDVLAVMLVFHSQLGGMASLFSKMGGGISSFLFQISTAHPLLALAAAGVIALTVAFTDNSRIANENRQSMQKLEDKWAEMSVAARKSALEQLEAFVATARAWGSSEEQLAPLVAEIEKLSDVTHSSVKAVEDWYATWDAKVQGVSGSTATTLANMEQDFKAKGASMVAAGNQIPEDIINYWQTTATPEAAAAARGTLEGAIGAMQATWDTGKVSILNIENELVSSLGMVGKHGELTAEWYAWADATEARLGLAKGTLSDIMETIGFKVSSIPDREIKITADTSQAENRLIDILDRWRDLFSIPLIQHVQVVTDQHGGGPILHSGGAVRAHSGYLAPDEVPIIAQRGEYMIQRSAVNYYGVPLMAALNSRAIPKGQAAIGPAGSKGVSIAGDLILSFPGVTNEGNAQGVTTSVINQLTQQAKQRKYAGQTQ